MICFACQAENTDTAASCSACGRDLDRSGRRGTLIASRYEVLGTLGRGGMGVVYKAHDTVLDEPVALKVLRADPAEAPGLLGRFRAEIKLARKVSHANVGRIHDCGDDHGLRYISMELVEGTDLKKRIREGGPVPLREAYDLALQVADGLEAIHKVGIVHRDLKSPNIMVDTHGVVKIMDFGIAKAVERTNSTGLTATGHIVGTPEYMSPEQARAGPVDCRTDIYALGVVLFELLTGRVPFRGDTPVATILKHLQEPPPLEGPGAENIPPQLVPLLRRALAKDPSERYPSVSEVARDLRAARDSLRELAFGGATAPAAPPTQAGATSPVAAQLGPSEASRAVTSQWRRLAVAALLVLTTGLGYWALARRSSQAPSVTVGALRPSAESQPAQSEPVRGPADRAREPPSSPAVQLGSTPRVAARSRAPVEPAPDGILPESGLAEGTELPVGTTLVITILGELRSDRCRPGQAFEASLAEALAYQGTVIAPAGTLLQGRVEDVGTAADAQPRPFLELSLTQLYLAGRPYPIRTAFYRLMAPPPAGRLAFRAVVIGAAAGALLGGTIAGKKGAAAGAASVVAAEAMFTEPAAAQAFVYTFGNRLTFRLAESIVIPSTR